VERYGERIPVRKPGRPVSGDLSFFATLFLWSLRIPVENVENRRDISTGKDREDLRQQEAPKRVFRFARARVRERVEIIMAKVKKKTELAKLSEAHKHFCRALVANPKMNQTQTYLDTLATPGMRRETASKKAVTLMKNKLIQIELKRLMDIRSARLDITADKVLAELASMAFMKFSDYAEYDEDGNVILKPSSEVDTRAIKSIKRRIVSTEEDSTTEAFEFKLHDKLKALELTMRHLGLLNDNLVNIGKVEVKVQLPHELTEDIIN